MSITSAIAVANAVLPGTPVDDGSDPRWQAIIRIGEYVESEPDKVWAFISQWGAYPQEDLRDAIATCLLEHLLEFHFAEYFPHVEDLAVHSAHFADTFLRCWQFGQADEHQNAQRWHSLRSRISNG